MKILVTGSDGLVGTAIRDATKAYNPKDLIFTTRNDTNLKDDKEVNHLFRCNRTFGALGPDVVIHCAGRVGGIGRNLTQPDEQFYDNLMINTNVLKACYSWGVKKTIVLSSMCIFPAKEEIFTEDNMHLGEPFPAHRAYAYAKRMADIQIEAYKAKRPEFNACILIPSNIFGANDNYSLEDGHVVPSLIHKAWLAKKNKKPFEVWGDGSAVREFIYSKDVAKVCLELMNLRKLPDRLILSGNAEKSIKEVAELIHQFMCPKQPLVWLKDKPNGQLRRPSSKELFNKTFPEFKFSSFRLSLKASCKWFEDNKEIARW